MHSSLISLPSLCGWLQQVQNARFAVTTLLQRCQSRALRIVYVIGCAHIHTVIVVAFRVCVRSVSICCCRFHFSLFDSLLAVLRPACNHGASVEGLSCMQSRVCGDVACGHRGDEARRTPASGTSDSYSLRVRQHLWPRVQHKHKAVGILLWCPGRDCSCLLRAVNGRDDSVQNN